LVCDQTPLNELVEALNGIYGQHIVIANPQLKRMAITTIFKDQSLDQILDVVAETFKISVEHKNGQIILK
jgi:transmembrane sensor